MDQGKKNYMQKALPLKTLIKLEPMYLYKCMYVSSMLDDIAIHGSSHHQANQAP